MASSEELHAGAPETREANSTVHESKHPQGNGKSSSPLSLTPDGKIRALLALYNNTWAESIRYRDYEWRITNYVLLLEVGVVYLIQNANFLQITYARAIWLVAFVTAGFFAAVGLLMHTHTKFVEERRMRAHLDEVLRFTERGAYVECERILDSSLRSERISKTRSWAYLTSFILVLFFGWLLVIFSISYKAASSQQASFHPPI